jgi:hypothetical protein
MSDEKPNPPNPLSDVVKGLGLLFRAAKTTVEKLPKKNLEEAVLTSAKEVGRALENVGRTIEREVLGKNQVFKEEGKAQPKTDEAPKSDKHEDDEPKPPNAA